jgi:GNAT superfamily N-acetyltransferase
LPQLTSLLERSPDESSFACIRNGELAGFLLGLEIPDFMGQRAAYSPEWANAALLDESWPIYEALYTRWSAYWANRATLAHLVSLLASDWDAVDAWGWLGFGMVVVDGVRDFSPLPQDCTGDYRILRLLPDAQGAFSAQALALVEQFDRALLEHLLAAPCFWPHDVEEASSFSGADWLSTPGNALWFAYQGDEPLGYLGITPNSQDACTIIRDPGTASIVKAYTLPAARGTGVGFTLLNHALAWAKEQGYLRCSVDYEAANPPARRFWERWFEPVVFSMMRVVLKKG